MCSRFLEDGSIPGWNNGRGRGVGLFHAGGTPFPPSEPVTHHASVSVPCRISAIDEKKK